MLHGRKRSMIVPEVQQSKRGPTNQVVWHRYDESVRDMAEGTESCPWIAAFSGSYLSVQPTSQPKDSTSA